MTSEQEEEEEAPPQEASSPEDKSDQARQLKPSVYVDPTDSGDPADAEATMSEAKHTGSPFIVSSETDSKD